MRAAARLARGGPWGRGSRGRARTPVRGCRRSRPDVDPRVYVRVAPEVPDHRRTLELPHVPDAVLADVQVLAERHPERLDAAVRLDEAHRLVAILLPERQQQ